MIYEGHERRVTPIHNRRVRARHAVAVLVRAFDECARDGGECARGASGGDIDAATLYDAALTVVMRLVYMSSVARHGLLADGGADGALAFLAALHSQLRAGAGGDAGLAPASHDAWQGLLAAFRSFRVALGRGVGPLGDDAALFDPGRYSFLREQGRPDEGDNLLPINNKTVLAVLDMLDGVLGAGEAGIGGYGFAGTDGATDGAGRREDAGLLYQELRDDTAVRAAEPLLGLMARGGRACVVPLQRLEGVRAAGDESLLAYLHGQTGRAASSLAAGLGTRASRPPRTTWPGETPASPEPPCVDESSSPDAAGADRALAGQDVDDREIRRRHAGLLAACDGDTDLCRRALPFAGLVSIDQDGRPAVEPAGHVYVERGRGRRASGTHYTPPAVAATVVRHALDQVAYIGPAEGWRRAEWRLKPAEELLSLTVCDMAMGGGVFLVESCRYLAERIVESWEESGPVHPGAAIDPLGRSVDRGVGGVAIPDGREERLRLARRLVAGRCLYGVDRDPIAVELARLALWTLVDGPGAARPIGAGGGVDVAAPLYPRLRAGDALIGAPTNCRLPTPDVPHVPLSFDWPHAFPEVFARGFDAGFDAIVGNPPFGNGIEGATARDAGFKRYAAAHYAPFAHGAGDYCLLFWARALLHLLASGGAYGWLGPTALLSDPKPWQAWVHAHARPTTLILYPVDLFPAARIRTTGYCGRRGQASTVTVIDHDMDTDTGGEPSPVTRPWSAAPGRWYDVIHGPGLLDQVAHRGRPDVGAVSLSSLPLRLHAGCATAAAYSLAPLVEDDAATGARLVTTGALDRYACLWGSRPIRYLHRTYRRPRWPAIPVAPAAVTRALDRQRGPKILVGGLTAVLECWLDARGEAAGVVSTWVLAPDPGVTLDGLYTLLTILNSATFSRLYMERHGARSMSGRHTTIYQRALRDMPCPAPLARAMLSPAERGAAPGLDTTAGLLATCCDVGRALQETSVEGARRRAVDRLGHRAAGLLYGRGEDGAAADYAWWRGRAGAPPDDIPPAAL